MVSRNLVTIMICCLAIPLWAQEEAAHMKAPPSIEDSFINWMLGEWRGETSSEQGKAEDYMKCELGLEGQFLILNRENFFFQMKVIIVFASDLKRNWTLNISRQ